MTENDEASSLPTVADRSPPAAIAVDHLVKVYKQTRAVDDIFAALQHTKIPCARYHGGMSDVDRGASQARFMAKTP